MVVPLFFCTVPFVIREWDTEGLATEPLVILLWVVAPGGSVRTLPSAAPLSSGGNMKICFATFFPVRLLSRRNTDIRRGCDMTQIRRDLLIGCEGLLDVNMHHA